MVPYVFVVAALALRPGALQAALLPDRHAVHSFEDVRKTRIIAKIVAQNVA